MTREEFINHPATSASRIKRFYTGDISYAQTALDAGAAFHFDLLEQRYEDMSKSAKKVYEAIHELELLGAMFDNAAHEYIHVGTVNVNGINRAAKGMMDICWHEFGIIADIKTTSAKNIEAFAADMTKHLNHVQAVWYSMLMGFDPVNFYYIGVPPKVKKTGKFKDLYLYRHNADEIGSAKLLIENYFKNENN